MKMGSQFFVLVSLMLILSLAAVDPGSEARLSPG